MCICNIIYYFNNKWIGTKLILLLLLSGFVSCKIYTVILLLIINRNSLETSVT